MPEIGFTSILFTFISLLPLSPSRIFFLLLIRQTVDLKVAWGFPGSSAGKKSACNAGDPSWIPGLGRSPGEGKGYPLQYSSLENSMNCIVHGVPKSQTRLSDLHFTSPQNSQSSKWSLENGWFHTRLDYTHFPILCSLHFVAISL